MNEKVIDSCFYSEDKVGASDSRNSLGKAADWSPLQSGCASNNGECWLGHRRSGEEALYRKRDAVGGGNWVYQSDEFLN
jgi:hypothetical protein